MSGDASVLVLLVRMSLDYTCRPVAIESFDAHECGEGDPPATDESGNTISQTPAVWKLFIIESIVQSRVPSPAFTETP